MNFLNRFVDFPDTYEDNEIYLQRNPAAGACYKVSSKKTLIILLGLKQV